MNSPVLSRHFLSILIISCATSLLAASPPRVATFRADVTPDLGEPLIWVTPATSVESPLWAKGIVLEDNGNRYVLCAVDWCGIGGPIDLLLRSRISTAARTSVDRVALQSVHQHTAPYVDGDGYGVLAGLKSPPLMMSERFLRRVADRLAHAVGEATARLQPFDHIGTGQAVVEKVASARRVFQDGKLITRYSGGGKDPDIAALPEGPVDPVVRTITFALETRPIVTLHYYASHPQTFCCDGRVSGDFVGSARESVEREERLFQVYFTGCAGDVTVGKYNDGSTEARNALALRLGAAMRAAIASARFEPVEKLMWRSADLGLPIRQAPESDPAARFARIEADAKASGQDLYRAAIPVGFARRQRPLPASSLRIGNTVILHLPGEPMLAFQKYAQQQFPGLFVAVAGYGDISPGYLCTDAAFAEGGYEPSASHAGPGTEARVKEAIRSLLGY